MKTNAFSIGSVIAEAEPAAISRPRSARWIILAGCAAILVAGSLSRPLNHDESQYVASSVIALHGLPYRDFDYLQTPLQPLIFAPLTRLWPGHLLLLLRFVSALLGCVSVAALGAALRIAGCPRDRALAMSLLLIASEPFLFGASTIRNDILPCSLECAALCALMAVGGADGGHARTASAIAGLLLGMACATKISYALPLAAVVPAEILHRRTGHARLSIPAYLLGATIPLAVTAVIALQAPATFWFDVFLFPSAAPRQWYTAGPDASKLTLLGRAFDYIRFAMLGPAPLLAFRLVQTRGARCDWATRMLDAMLAAAFVASLLTTPVWRQYLLPVLPLLIMRVGIAPVARMNWRYVAASVALCAAGLAITVGWVVTALSSGSPVFAAERDAGEMRRLLHGTSPWPVTASLSPQRVVDAGFPIDPRFAAGPFLFRTRDGLGRSASLIGVTQASFDRRLEMQPPDSIVTGGEALDSGRPVLDAVLTAWAVDHGYRLAGTTAAGMSVYLRPTRVLAHRPNRSA